MSFREKNFAVTLVNFSLILIFYTVRIAQLVLNGNFDAPHVFRLFGVVVVMAVVVSILALILTHFLSAFIHSVRTQEEPDFEDFEDERDKLIDLRGTKMTYHFSSLGSFVAMLTYVFGQSPLVMFSLLIYFGVLAQIIGDLTRLYLYRRGL